MSNYDRFDADRDLQDQLEEARSAGQWIPWACSALALSWWGGAAAIHGKNDSGFSYDLMVSEGLYAKDGYTIRSGRQKAAKANANNLAYTGRIKYTGVPGLELAATARLETDLGQGEVAGSGAD